MKLGLLPLVAVLLSLPSAASAQPDPDAAAAAPVPVPVPVPDSPSSPAPPPSTDRQPPLTLGTDAPPSASPPRYDYLRFGAGVRVGYITDPTFDAFADSDTLAQVSLDATYAFFTRGKLAIAAGLAYDAGSRASGARGLTTKLTMHRISVPIEARYYFAPWFNAFAKVAPGTGALVARVEDPSSPRSLEDTPWVFAADLSAGASFRLVGPSDHAKRHPRLWITQEVGYGLTTSAGLRPSPGRDEADVLGSDQSTRLGSLAMNGIFWRTSLAVSF